MRVVVPGMQVILLSEQRPPNNSIITACQCVPVRHGSWCTAGRVQTRSPRGILGANASALPGASACAGKQQASKQMYDSKANGLLRLLGMSSLCARSRVVDSWSDLNRLTPRAGKGRPTRSTNWSLRSDDLLMFALQENAFGASARP